MSDRKKQSRLTPWFATACFSTIALVAIVNDFEGDIGDQPKESKWAVSGVSIALSFSCLAILGGMLLKNKFNGTLLEGCCATLTFGFWAAVTPAIMHPQNNLAVSTYWGGILNNNLYFFSWFAFFMSFAVLALYLDEVRGERDVVTGTRMWMWAALLFTSFVVMVTGIRSFDENNCDNVSSGATLILPNGDVLDLNDACKRFDGAIAMGAISVIVSLCWLFLGRCLKGRLGTLVEITLAWLMLAMWLIGAIYLTFEPGKAPGRQLGNLYFFTWGSFAVCILMGMASLQTLFGDKDEETHEEAGGHKDEGPTSDEEEGHKDDAPMDEETT